MTKVVSEKEFLHNFESLEELTEALLRAGSKSSEINRILDEVADLAEGSLFSDIEEPVFLTSTLTAATIYTWPEEYRAHVLNVFLHGIQRVLEVFAEREAKNENL